MSVSDLKVGNVAYVLSGRQNSFFNATVMEKDETGVRVYVHAKKEEQWYYNDGNADATADDGEDGPPRAILVTADDWRIKVLMARRRFKFLHKAVQDATNEFRKDPSAENGQALTDAVMEWRQAVLFSDDPNALRAESIQEYLDLSAVS